MISRRRSLAAIVAPFVVIAVCACGEEGQTIGANQCPELPLYSWQFTDAGGWVRVDSSGHKVEGPPASAYQDQPNNNGRCQTPPGYSVSVDQGTGGTKTGAGGAGGAKGGAGGTKNKDAGKD